VNYLVPHVLHFVCIFYTRYLLLAHQLYHTLTLTLFFQVLMKEEIGQDNLAIAWKYPGQYLEVIPAIYSRNVKPGWPVTCVNDSDCDDGVWCNGKLFYLKYHLRSHSKYEDCI
jgi:hypothetical protein